MNDFTFPCHTGVAICVGGRWEQKSLGDIQSESRVWSTKLKIPTCIDGEFAQHYPGLRY